MDSEVAKLLDSSDGVLLVSVVVEFSRRDGKSRRATDAEKGDKEDAEEITEDDEVESAVVDESGTRYPTKHLSPSKCS